MSRASAVVLSCGLLAGACSEVLIDDAPSGGGGAGAAGGQPATSGPLSSMTSSSGGEGGASGGAGTGGAGTGGSGGAPLAIPVCSSPDTFDSGVLDDRKWSAFPRGAFSLEDGEVDLHGDLAYLKLHTQPQDCAFTFEIVSLAGGRVSLQVVGEGDSLVHVQAESDGVAAFRWDAALQEGELVEGPVAGVPLGLALLFIGDDIGCAARYESGWQLIASFPSPAWFDDEQPEVRFVDLDGGGSTRIDDYGVEPVQAGLLQLP